MSNMVTIFVQKKQSEILGPAVQGTLNVLHSCRKNPALVRVVLASSSSAVRVRDDFDPNVPLDESSWSSLELCEKLKVETVATMYPIYI